jgi:hypothetical protein
MRAPRATQTWRQFLSLEGGAPLRSKSTCSQRSDAISLRRAPNRACPQLGKNLRNIGIEALCAANRSWVVAVEGAFSEERTT